MKKFIPVLLLVFSMIIVGCKCKNEEPRARVINEGSEEISVQIMTSGGNTENINNIAPGETSEFKYYAPGEVQFTIVVGEGNNATEYNENLLMEECFEYDIILDSENNITSVPTDRNE